MLFYMIQGTMMTRYLYFRVARYLHVITCTSTYDMYLTQKRILERVYEWEVHDIGRHGCLHLC